MGQDGEEAAELVATIRGEHIVMKKWFMGESPEAKSLREKYGPYPSMWKEVLNWPGWKEARKEYLRHTQKGESSSIPRKRRSRWGTADDGEDANNKRRSRWGREESSGPTQTHTRGRSPGPVGTGAGMGTTPSTVLPTPALPGLVLPGMPTNLNPQQQEEMRSLQARLRVCNEKLQNLEMEAARVDSLPRGHPDRSPSPPPVYGADGKRKNTRAVRWRERYSAERHDVLEQLMNMNPATRKSGLFKRKRTKKIRIPVDEHPTYNFIGLIIGPRGKTQKELEAKTGCKIAIRGRGSVKEGARGRRDGKVMEGDNEPLHVVITGDDQKSVDAATDMIEQMLVVIDDEKNVHKQQQLRELALLNGTLKEEEYCQICAEKGHRSFECPKRFAMNKASVAVKCAICGDTSHPTRDCTQKIEEKKNTQELDSDYNSFMAELEGKKAEQAPRCTVINGSGPNTNALPIPQAAKASDTTAPPPPVATRPQAISLPPPPPPTGLPPPPPTTTIVPPPAVPPPPPSTAPSPYDQGSAAQYYTGQQQQGVHQYNYAPGQQPYPPPMHGQAQSYTQQQQQHQQQQQPRPGDETSGWDYRSYYGYGGGGGDAGGAGGFNWWG